MWSYLKSEPAAVMALLGALIALAVAFGLQLTPKQVGAINAVVAILLGFVTRSRVSPVT